MNAPLPSGAASLPATPALAALAAAPAACRLADLGVIRAHGDDAASFLQGQLTQDVAGLPVGQARLAGYCSPKGRLIASFVAWRVAADEFWLVCSADLLAPTLKRLSMFVLRAKCKLSDLSAERACWGVAGPATWAEAAIGAPGLGAVSGAGTLVRLPDADGLARALWLAPADAAAPVAGALEPAAWAWLEVRSAVPRIVAATVDAFVPQMVNFEAVGGVNFQKGCYPGQEVVARSQYRGTLKRRALPAVLAGDAGPAAAGDEVFAAAEPDQPAGQVVLCADWPGAGPRSRAALVEVKLAHGEPGATLHLRAADGPALRLEALPYALPAQ
jgi:folate-binding protein YgfZ